MTKHDLIREMAQNIEVKWSGYGTWKITCAMEFPLVKPFNSIHDIISGITHNQDDMTGIFDGKAYNELCGFNTLDELDEVARQECMTTEAYQQAIWQDSANEDNYEPRADRNLRLATRLWDEFIEYKDWYEYLDIE